MNNVIVVCNKEHDITPGECCFCRAEASEHNFAIEHTAVQELLAQLAAANADRIESQRLGMQAMDELAAANAEITALTAAQADAEFVRNWVCHNGGLLKKWEIEWAREWEFGSIERSSYLRKRLDAAIDAAKEKE